VPGLIPRYPPKPKDPDAKVKSFASRLQVYKLSAHRMGAKHC